METPKFTITSEKFNGMVEKLCAEISILENVASFAICIDNDFEWKFRENWKRHPEIIEAFDKLLESL